MMIEFISIAMSVVEDVSPGRMVESLVMLAIIWRGLKPHLTQIEKRLGGLEEALRSGFAKGETRFQNLEERVKALEQSKPKGGLNEKISIV